MNLLRVSALSLLMAGSAFAQSPDFVFERPANSGAAVLRIQLTDGRVVEQRFAAGANLSIGTRLADGTTLGDGSHRYEINFAPQLSAAQRTQATSVRADGQGAVPAGWPAPIAPRAGMLYIVDGMFQPMLEEQRRDSGHSKGTKDQVIADDLIVAGSACFGFDCVDGENFGFDTIRLKENNTRIGFNDTSVGAFPSNDWQLEANQSQSGGANAFSLLDVTGDGRRLFTVTAGAPTASLFVSSVGRVGFRTSTPALDLHIATDNTPGLRLDQSGAGGFTPQTWDVAGNEENFFVRDVTGGSRLPFRIRPGAPTSSLDISASGDVGMGAASPGAALHLRRDAAFTGSLLLIETDANATDENRALQLEADGDLYVGGTITQLSSRFSKTNFATLPGEEVLSRLAQLPILTWNYLGGEGDRHIGPVAEEFYAAFGFGRDEKSLAPADVAGVALAATQALQQEIAVRDQRISELEARLQRLEAALESSDRAPR